MKYEELLISPQEVLADMFNFSNVDMEDHLLHPEEIKEDDVVSGIDGIWFTQDMLQQQFDLNKIGRWKRELGLKNRISSSIIMARNLQRMDYDIDPISIFVHDKIRLLHSILHKSRRIAR